MLDKNFVKEYYSNQDMCRVMSDFCMNREVGVKDGKGQFWKRPNILMYPSDISAMVKRGAVCFHSSVERWTNPMMCSDEAFKGNRMGFDWVIDIDSKSDIEVAKIFALEITKVLEKYSLIYFIKFSGRRGFHICVFWENFPEVFMSPTSQQYPQIPKMLTKYVKEVIKPHLIADLSVRFGKEVVNPYEYAEVEDEWSNRHLFRVPYSLHDGTGLSSVIIPLDRLSTFETEDALPGNFDIFSVRKEGNIKGMIKLLSEAWNRFGETERTLPSGIFNYNGQISEKDYPPCIRKILGGVKDGKKRALYILVTYFSTKKMSWENIEKLCYDWAERGGLERRYVKSQLEWHKKLPTPRMPFKCDNSLYYKDTGFCRKDKVCERITNPLFYRTSNKRKKRELII